MTFPPSPIFPLAIDSERTLFLVYNTTEARITSDNQPWADEIAIEPVDADEPEIWPENGFANISGELFYYDKVGKDVNGKINRLIRCARNLGGKQTQFNLACTWVRGFVVAEHHNQLVDVLMNIENFIGVDDSDDPMTLDYRIKNLVAQPECIDDFDCPSVNFHFDVADLNSCNADVTANNPCSGKIATYNVQISGQFANYRLDFGDGTFTSDTSGTHVYSTNANIDPVVTVGNSKCQIVQTPTTRTNPEEPQQLTPVTEFRVPIPPPPEFPTIIIPSNFIPSTTFTLPPFVGPCIDFGPIGPINVPSVISIVPPIQIPSLITITPVNIPSIILFGPVPTIPPIEFGPLIVPDINFGPFPDVPDINFGPFPAVPDIQFGPVPAFPPIEITGGGGIPSTISIQGDIPSVISLVGISVISVSWGTPPNVSVIWGTPPTLSCVVTVQCPGSSMAETSSQVTDDFVDSLSANELKMDTFDVGIPDEIKVVFPTVPDIKLTHDLPTEIKLNVPFISDINLVLPEGGIPSEIRFVTESIIPDRIIFDVAALPTHIELTIPSNFPSSIYLDASGVPTSIQVIGVPSSISLIGNIPSEIIVKVPETMEIPLVYKGGPIPFRFDSPMVADGEDTPCFAITPCPRR
jgi:hypothetical protein